MFKCEKCGRQTRPLEKAHFVTVATQVHTFPRRRDANTFKRGGGVEHTDDRGGTGEQIVKELRLGSCCALGAPAAQKPKSS